MPNNNQLPNIVETQKEFFCNHFIKYYLSLAKVRYRTCLYLNRSNQHARLYMKYAMKQSSKNVLYMCLQRTLGSLNVFTKGNVFHTLHPPHPKTATPGQPPKKKKKNQNNSKKNNYLCPSPSYLVLFLPNATHEEFDHQCRRVSTVILLCGQVGSLGSWGHDVTFS